MKTRTNEHYSHIVNRGLIMFKFRGYDESKYMMVKAQLPNDVIDRVLNQPPLVRNSDYR